MYDITPPWFYRHYPEHKRNSKAPESSKGENIYGAWLINLDNIILETLARQNRPTVKGGERRTGRAALVEAAAVGANPVDVVENGRSLLVLCSRRRRVGRRSCSRFAGHFSLSLLFICVCMWLLTLRSAGVQAQFATFLLPGLSTGKRNAQFDPTWSPVRKPKPFFRWVMMVGK